MPKKPPVSNATGWLLQLPKELKSAILYLAAKEKGLLIAKYLFIPFAAPNVISTVHDVTLPEVRSTALAVQYFIESAGAATAPLLAGLIAVRSSLHDAILIVCEITWVLCAIFFAVVAYLVPRDIEALRQALRERAEMERRAIR